jgi:hypothetical protein
VTVDRDAGVVDGDRTGGVVTVDGGDWTATGEAIDCRTRAVTAAALAAAIRAGPATAAATDDHPVSVSCPRPDAVFERVGVVREGTSLSVRGAVAAAARSRGVEAESAEDLAAARETLAAVEVPDVDVSAARERVATARAAAESVGTDVAAARGVVSAREELGGDVEAAREALREAVATASERRTAVAAAEQALARERERAREARDARRRRLELADRVGRLERDVRAELANAVWGAFVDAVAAVPGGDPAVVGPEPGSFEGDDATAALAAVRIADAATPAVLAAGRFASAERARAVLDAPVILASASR